MAKKKIAVLHAQVPFIRGGAEQLVENLTRNLVRRGFQADLVTIPFKWYPNRALLDSYLMWRMADLSESNGEQIDLLIALKAPTFLAKHTNKVVWLMHQHRAAYDLRDSVIAGGLNTIPGGKEIIAQITEIDRMALLEANSIYAISKNVSARLKQFNGIASVPMYHPPSLEGRYYTGKYGNYILSVGRLNAIKRTDLLIRALPFCDKHVHVKIAGRGQEAEALEKLARELGVEDRVEMLGFIPDEGILELYANALAVCFPPLDEDYGYITLESFLSKKPILTCWDSGGVLEFAQDGENAFIVDCDAEKMGGCFQKLYQNKRMAREMGEAGYLRVKDISWDHVIDELTKTIR